MPEANQKSFERLPKTVVPKHYNITLKPDLKETTFEGRSVIQVEVEEPTNNIVLNVLQLNISKASYKDVTQNIHEASNIEIKESEETVTVSFSNVLPVGLGELHLEFDGQLNDKMKGFYRSKYTTPDGEERFAAVTQFEPTDARSAFPCWDEPAIKCTFDMTLVVPKDRVALSNMNVISDTPLGDLREVKFATTPIMSTYLIACVVGEYDYVEGVSSDGVEVRVYTPLAKKEQGLFALEVAVKTLPYYKDYFNIAYPLPKMDLIAIADFAAGAMENWGLITYRETCLLVDPQNTSSERKQWIALTVGHEIAHQWFGNLVTMEWWTHLWLNEGFASFIEFLCVHELFPQYDIWTQFVSDVYSSALDLDALNNSHPIEVTVGHPSEIDEIFDNISYDKGASVIRMLHKFIGDECFKKGMHAYLTKHAYRNTSTEDLWESLEDASQKPVAAVMTTWTKQKGFPVITISSKQDGSNRILTLTQEKFHADGKSDGQNHIWMVPITISTAADPSATVKQVLLDSKSMDVVLEGVQKDHWVKLNPGTVGFYRTLYSEEMMAQIVPGIADLSLPPLDRLGLQGDLFAMVQASRAPTVQVLKLIEAYSQEPNYTVWSSINACLSKLNTLLSHTDFQPLFHSFCRRLFAKIHAKLGWDTIKGESHLDKLLRSLVISTLASSNEETVIAEAKKRFEAHMNGTSILPADLRRPVYKAAVVNGDEKTFETMLKLYRESDMQEEKDRISRALGAVTDEGRIRRVLEFSMSEEVRSQSTVLVIIAVSLTKPGRELAWNFFQEKKEELRERYKGGFLITRLVKFVTENFASEEKAQEVEAFFAKNKYPSAERTVQQSLETIRLNANWLARDQEAIKAYLSSHS